MNIGFDARPLTRSPVGVGLYINNLVSFLAKKKINCYLFFDKKLEFKVPKSRYIKAVVIDGLQGSTSANRLFWEQVMLPFYLKNYKIDLFHATDNKGAPMESPCPIILTVHDLIPWLTPNFHPSLEKELFYKFSVRNSCKTAKQIITVSNYTKRDLVKTLKINKNKIHVVYNGIDLDFSIPLKKIIVQSKILFGINTDYIIYVGGIAVRKNIESLIKSFAAIKNDYKKLTLVVVGKKVNNYPELEEMARKLKLRKSIVFTGYVDNKIKYALVCGAKALVYPSFFEGFGIPILEGMFCGVPVISSNTTSIPEIAGDAAILIDPYDYRTIVKAIDKILSDENLAKTLVKKGQGRVKMFSLEKMGQNTLQMYNKVLRGEL